MANLNQNEFNSIREVALNHITSANKLETYAQHCSCPETKAMFSTAANDARQGAQKLMNML